MAGILSPPSVLTLHGSELYIILVLAEALVFPAAYGVLALPEKSSQLLHRVKGAAYSETVLFHTILLPIGIVFTLYLNYRSLFGTCQALIIFTLVLTRHYSCIIMALVSY